MTIKEFAIELPAIRDEAKVIWGESEIYQGDYTLIGKAFEYPRTLGWESHLKAMIESDDPVKYLKDNT